MTGNHSLYRSNLVLCLASGLLVSLCWFLLTWRYGFDFADEGYYWYGAQRVLRGEAPIRDFLAYDIGRYLWAAAVMSAIGDDGIFGARLAAGLFQALTVSVGVFIALQAVQASYGTARRILFAFLVALLLNVWATPYYKSFDYGTSILIVGMLMLILTSRAVKYWFGAGLILGLAAVMGRNHGVYGAASALMALGFLLVKKERPSVLLRPALAFMGGTAIGFSLTFVMGLYQPGFMAALIAGIIDHVRSTATATNIPLPVPWPWKATHDENGWILWAGDFATGMAFIALLVVPVLAIAVLARKPLAAFTRLHYLQIAAAFAGLVYAHYAYSRADVVHLALSIVPVLVILLNCGVLVRQALPVAVCLVGLSLLMLLEDLPLLSNVVLDRKMTTVVMNGSELHVHPFVVEYLQSTEHVFSVVPEARDNFLALPNFPGLHAVNKARMGVWEIYALSARDARFEQAELARLASRPPAVVMLSNHALDDRPDLRYSVMHPLMYKWIMDNYHPATLSHPSRVDVYVRNTGAPAP